MIVLRLLVQSSGMEPSLDAVIYEGADDDSSTDSSNPFISSAVRSGFSASDISIIDSLFTNMPEELNSAVFATDDRVFSNSFKRLADGPSFDSDHLFDLISCLRTVCNPSLKRSALVSFSDGDFEFQIVDNITKVVSLVAYHGSDSEVDIPSDVSHDGVRYRLTSIASLSFDDRSDVTVIRIPDSVVSIGYRAFSSCSALESVFIPSSVRSIGFRAFEGCVHLAKIDVDSRNPRFYADAHGILFSRDPKEVVRVPCAISGRVVIPDGICIVGSESFEDCSRITEVVIPDSTTEIMYKAFLGCDSLSRISVPDSAHHGFQAFPANASLELRPVSDQDPAMS